jgi:hypothetical protein
LTTADMAVLLFGDRGLPRPLRGLPRAGLDDLTGYRRVVVVGSEGDLATVLTRLLRADRLDIEVGHLPGRRGARRAVTGVAHRVPLIRDETGTVIVGAVEWTGSPLYGEAVVDDTVLFDGDVPGVRIEPTTAMPGLRAAVLSRRGRPLRWVAGRAAQLGSPGAKVTRDGVAALRPVRRSTFYRHTEGWLMVR